MKTQHDSEIPKVGQQVITACAFIHHNFDGVEKLFLPRRAETKKFLPGIFELPGGHIDFGEDVAVGLKREIQEEFSVDITVGDPFFVFAYQNPIKGSHSVEIIYFASLVTSPENIVLNPEDHAEYRWISSSEIPALISTAKNDEDPEWQAIRKGFVLLEGAKLKFD